MLRQIINMFKHNFHWLIYRLFIHVCLHVQNERKCRSNLCSTKRHKWISCGANVSKRTYHMTCECGVCSALWQSTEYTWARSTWIVSIFRVLRNGTYTYIYIIHILNAIHTFIRNILLLRLFLEIPYYFYNILVEAHTHMEMWEMKSCFALPFLFVPWIFICTLN